MQVNVPDGGTSAVANPKLLSPYHWLTLLTTLLVLLQAVLAGQGLFEDRDFIDIHEMVANIFFLAVVLQLLATVLLKAGGPIGKQLLIMNGLLLVLTLVQIGLGYAGRETAQAAAWHIPNGVLLFGLAGTIHSMVGRLRVSD
ncbi:hypothetical protein BH23CHL4_BH23CHL4_20690 [soil metagenome]